MPKSSSHDNKRLQQEQMRLLSATLAGPILMSMAIALFLFFLQHEGVEKFWPTMWLGALILVSCWRLLLAFLAQKEIQDTDRFLRLLAFSRLAIWFAAAVWGASSLILYPNFSVENQPIFIITISGLAAASIVSLCSHWQSTVVFLSLTLLPLAIRLSFSTEKHNWLLGILVTCFYGVCLYAARKLHNNIADNITLRFHSQDHANSLKLIEERYLHIFNRSPIGILHFDTSGKILECNDLFGTILGLRPENDSEVNIFSLFPYEPMIRAVRETLAGGESTFTGDLPDAKGREIPVRIVFKATTTTDQYVNGGIAILIDYTERKQFEQTIKHQASYDSLTGLTNRRLLLEHLGQEIHRAIRHEQIGAVLFIDLDNFKSINDSLGYQAGDQLLIQVAGKLTTNLRKEDIVARMSGDEFIVLLPHLESSQDKAAQKAQEVTDKLAEVLVGPYTLNDQQLSITACMGITLFPAEVTDAPELLKQANTAVNQAKRVGPGTVRFFRPSMQEAITYRLQLNNDIKRAISNRELALFYQPQVKADGTIVGAEALIRWLHPERGIVPPADFITVAEESAVILDIGDWVLQQACATIKGWEEQQLLRHDQTISINVSPQEFSTHDFIDRIISTIEKSGIDPQHLGIELTEGSLITSLADTVAKIEQLRAYGLKFSVDDFGTGYSSLSYLQKLPLHTLKIDRSFVNDIRLVDDKGLLVELIIAMALNLGLNIVAEGVETTGQLSYLTHRGCQIFQGYYFCKPTDEKTFTELLRQGQITTAN